MRFVIALMRHESNTFLPLATPLRAFHGHGGDGLLHGDAAVTAMAGINFPISA